MKKIFLGVVVSTVLCSNIAFAETVNLSDQIITLDKSNVLTVEPKQPLTDTHNEVETKRNWFCIDN